jgi:O-antigen/teichoic acid export membrane protein
MPGLAHSRYVTIADQIVSSLSNFALLALVANVVTPEAFGRFSLGYVILLFFLGFQRALVGEVLLVRFSGSAARPPGVDSAAVGVSLGVGVVSAVTIAAVGAVMGGDVVVWGSLALAGPIVFVQDMARYVLISRQRSGHALASDVLWLVLSVPAMAIVAAAAGAASTIVVIWVVGAVLAGALALRLARLAPRPVSGVRWLVRNRDIAIRFSAEYSSLNLSNTVVWFVLTGPVGVAGVAALRGASLLFSPLNTAFNAVRIAVVPELVRAEQPHRYRSRLREAGVVLLVLGLGWGGAALLIPDSWGELVLGQTWQAAAPLRVPYAVQGMAMVGYTLLLAHFRARSLHSASTIMRGALAGLTLLLPLGLALLAAEAGAAWGFAAAVAVSVAVGGIALRRRRDVPG